MACSISSRCSSIFRRSAKCCIAHWTKPRIFRLPAAAATELTEAFIILAGGGLKKENIEQGMQVSRWQFNLKQMQEHFERLDKCGMPERKSVDRSKL